MNINDIIKDLQKGLPKDQDVEKMMKEGKEKIKESEDRMISIENKLDLILKKLENI